MSLTFFCTAIEANKLKVYAIPKNPFSLSSKSALIKPMLNKIADTIMQIAEQVSPRYNIAATVQ
jgi:hypothetical protein